MSSLQMPMQLALGSDGHMTLLGQTVRRDTASNRGSVRDVVQIFTGQPNTQLGKTVERLFEAHPELMARCHQLKINGAGRETPVADAPTLLEIIWLCPGKTAREVRAECAKDLCRMMAGDLSLAEEIRRRHEDMAGTEAAAFLVPESESDDDDEENVPPAPKPVSWEITAAAAPQARVCLEVAEAANAAMQVTNATIQAYRDTLVVVKRANECSRVAEETAKEIAAEVRVLETRGRGEERAFASALAGLKRGHPDTGGREFWEAPKDKKLRKGEVFLGDIVRLAADATGKSFLDVTAVMPKAGDFSCPVMLPQQMSVLARVTAIACGTRPPCPLRI